MLARREQAGALDLPAPVTDHPEALDRAPKTIVSIAPPGFAKVVHGGQLEDSRKGRLLIQVFGHSERFPSVGLGLKPCRNQAAGERYCRERPGVLSGVA